MSLKKLKHRNTGVSELVGYHKEGCPVS